MDWREELEKKCYGADYWNSKTHQYEEVKMIDLSDVMVICQQAIDEAYKAGLQKAVEICKDVMLTMPTPADRLKFYVHVTQAIEQAMK